MSCIIWYTCYEDSEIGGSIRMTGEGGICDFKQVVQEGPRMQMAFYQRPQGDEGPGFEDIQVRE